MFKLIVRFLFGYSLVVLGLNTGWWLLVLVGMLLILPTMTRFMEGVTVAIIAMKEDPQSRSKPFGEPGWE